MPMQPKRCIEAQPLEGAKNWYSEEFSVKTYLEAKLSVYTGAVTLLTPLFKGILIYKFNGNLVSRTSVGE